MCGVAVTVRHQLPQVSRLDPARGIGAGQEANVMARSKQHQLRFDLIDRRLGAAERVAPRLFVAPITALNEGRGVDVCRRDRRVLHVEQRVTAPAVQPVALVVQRPLVETRDTVDRNTDAAVVNSVTHHLLQILWPLLRDRGGTLSLVSHLHAKYYRFGYVTFVGSANLTAAALDWRAQANLELLVEARSEARLLEFEAAVRAQAVQVDETLYEHMRALVEALRPLEAPVIGASAVDAGDEGEREAGRLFEERREAALWLPESRTPQVLFDYYRGKLDRLSQGEREAAAVDLAAFPLPLGLEEGAFRAYIGWYLAQTSVVRRVDTLLVEPQRFGAVRASLRRMEDYPRDRDSSRDWQTLMRWLLYFLPDQYEAWEANYSEIFARRS